MKKEQLQIYVIAIGVKKKCRKKDRHYFELGYCELDADQERIKAVAQEVIRAKMKETHRAELHLDHAEVDGDMISCRLMDPRNYLIELAL